MTAAKAIMIGRSAGIVLLAVIAQVSVASSLSLFGVRPELTLLLAVAAGVSGGPDRGAVVGFALGLAYDLFLQSPLGLTALVYALVAYAAGSVQLQMAAHRRSSRMLFVGAGTIVGIVGWVLVARLVDAASPTFAALARVALVAGLINALAGLAATRLWAWVFATDGSTRLAA